MRRRVPALVVLALTILTTGIVTAWVRRAVQEQEQRLLTERGRSAGLVLSASIGSVDPLMGQLGTAAGALDARPSLFDEVAARQMAASPALRALAVLRSGPSGFVVEVASGPGLAVGQAIDGARALAAEKAMGTPKVVTTAVFVDGPDHVVGFAMGSPAAPPGTVLYRESRIVPGTPTRSTQTQPFAELKANLYAVDRPSEDQLVLATAERPEPGERRYTQVIPVGDSQWLLVATARHPLVGTLMTRLHWLVAAFGIAGSLLLAAALNGVLRRRDYALALVEKRTTELRESLVSRELSRQEAARARDEAMAASRMKSQFLANMSHEIRTPLNGVIGMNGLLLGTALDPEQQEFAEAARRSGEALLDLINDVLDFSKIEAGKLELETCDFDVTSVVEDVAEMFAPAAQTKGLEITVSVDPALPVLVLGDPGRVRQVLINLVSNAVKFTHEGEVAIAVRAGTEGSSIVHCEVTDTGIGLDRQAERQLFESFTQADASTTRQYGGTGLGLAISKRLVEMMGGQIGVSSEPGAGSTFWFAVPLPGAPGAVPVDPSVLAGVRVLIVDDNETSRTVLERQVAAWGAKPATARGGGDALRSLRQGVIDRSPYALVLLDMDMADMDGPAMADAMAEERSLDNVRLVLLSSVGVLRTSHPRIEASISKPIRRSALFNAMASALGLEARLPVAGTVAGDVSWHARPGSRALAVEDNPVNQRVVATMLARLGFRVDVAVDGREALAATADVAYDLVLMDCHMPGMNGYDATQEIRRREADDGSRRVPIVALTASALKGDEERCLAAGMDAYVAKPVRVEQLAEVLDGLLGQGEPVVTGGRRAGQEPAAVDREAVDQVRAMGVDLRASISDLRRSASEDIAAVKTGLAAADSGTVQEAAHRLKGAGLMLGGVGMAAVAGDIESRAQDGRLDLAGELVPALERSYDSLLAALEASV